MVWASGASAMSNSALRRKAGPQGDSPASLITVPATGLSDVQVELDARNYRFVQHRNKFGQEYSSEGRDRY